MLLLEVFEHRQDFVAVVEKVLTELIEHAVGRLRSELLRAVPAREFVSRHDEPIVRATQSNENSRRPPRSAPSRARKETFVRRHRQQKRSISELSVPATASRSRLWDRGAILWNT